MDTPARAVWPRKAQEADAANVYTVYRIYPGGELAAFARTIRIASVSIQADTRAKEDGDVLTQAVKLHEALLDSDFRPRMGWIIPANKFDSDSGVIIADAAGDWKIRYVTFLTAPWIIGKDDHDRDFATENFSLR